MKIVHHKPYARGVSQLMYVGDSEAVDKALIEKKVIGLGLAAFVLWLLVTEKPRLYRSW
jgi:hypothetical protein